MPSALMCTAVTLCILLAVFQPKNFEITFVNVGQGDCIYVSSVTGENFLIDTGRNEYDAVSFLKHNGISHIDKIFITHIDSDHSGGLESILENINVNEIVLPKLAHTETVLLGKRIACANVRYVDYTDEFVFGDCTIDVFWPGQTILKDDVTNNNSLGINITYKDRNFLLMGDIGTAAEEMIINEFEVDADVIKIGHHGSDGSTSDKLVEHTKPEYAVISVGENSYGHPAENVLLLLEKQNCNILRTDINGNITFVVNKDGTMKIK